MNIELIRPGALSQALGRSTRALRRDVKSGDFPAPLAIGKRAIAWRKADIEEWIRERSQLPWVSAARNLDDLLKTLSKEAASEPDAPGSSNAIEHRSPSSTSAPGSRPTTP
ncbi:helix-turn-helix transcriptional regulator [Parazoarcus communis]|uniref:helix-turn-helix transcriptional regulator n=1 Tax=Parazoarcus communis TaxID=41977 RepID=UPI001B7CDACB